MVSSVTEKAPLRRSSILTAYDTQKLLQEGLYGTEEERSKGAILGALDLYLDFINLFLFLLRFLGRTDD